MPTLPTYKPQVNPTVDQSVARQPVLPADTAVGDALQQVGKAGYEFATRIQQAQLDNEVTNADRMARENIDKTRFEVENDHSIPVEELPSRLRKATDAIIDASAGTISSNSAREGWTARAQQWSGESELYGQKLGRTRQIDGVKAGIIASTADLEAKAGDLGQDAATYAQSVKDAQGNITRHVASGFLSPEEGATQIAQLNATGLKDTTMRHESRIDDLIAGGDVTGAQSWLNAHGNEMIPSVRDQIQKVIAEKAPVIEGLKQGDQIYQASGRDLTKAARDAEKIANPLVREHVQQRLVYLNALDEKAKKDREDNSLDVGLKMMIDSADKPGVRYEALPSSVVAGLSGPGKERLFVLQKSLDNVRIMSAEQRALMERASKDNQGAIMSMADNPNLSPLFLKGPGSPEWKQLGLQDGYDQMMPREQIAINDTLQKRLALGGSTDAANTAFTSVHQMLVRNSPADWKFSATPAQRAAHPEQFKQVQAVEAEVWKQVQDWTTTHGSKDKVPDEDAKLMMINAFAKVKNAPTMPFAFPNARIPGYDVGNRQSPSTIDNDVMQVTMENLARKSPLAPKPTQAQIDAEYARVLALKGGAK